VPGAKEATNRIAFTKRFAVVLVKKDSVLPLDVQNLARGGSERGATSRSAGFGEVLDEVLVNPRNSAADSNFLMTGFKALI
jgi:hypothetical protein